MTLGCWLCVVVVGCWLVVIVVVAAVAVDVVVVVVVLILFCFCSCWLLLVVGCVDVVVGCVFCCGGGSGCIEAVAFAFVVDYGE